MCIYCRKMFLKNFALVMGLFEILAILFGFAVARSDKRSRAIDNHPNWRLLNEEGCGMTMRRRIIGGAAASMGQFPWMARIGYLSKSMLVHVPKRSLSQLVDFKCGGALISKYHVITGAHCVTNLDFMVEVKLVRLGEYDTQSDPDCVGNRCAEPVVDIETKSTYYHESYNEPALRNDIAIITLKEQVKFTRSVAPICVPKGSLLSANHVGQEANVAGWGAYDYKAKPKYYGGSSNDYVYSTVLKTVEIPILRNEKCERAFVSDGVKLSSGQICAGGKPGEDSCNGDSGGPLMKVMEDEKFGQRYYLIGVTSAGKENCGSYSPGIYTNVQKYVAWILDNISEM